MFGINIFYESFRNIWWVVVDEKDSYSFNTKEEALNKVKEILEIV